MTQKKAMQDKDDVVADCVEDHLQVVQGAKLRIQDIIEDFRKMTGTDDTGFSDKRLADALEKAIREKGPAWDDVKKYNGRDGSGREPQKCKGMLYSNLTFKDRNKAKWNSKYLPGSVTTHDRFTPDRQPFTDS